MSSVAVPSKRLLFATKWHPGGNHPTWFNQINTGDEKQANISSSSADQVNVFFESTIYLFWKFSLSLNLSLSPLVTQSQFDTSAAKPQDQQNMRFASRWQRHQGPALKQSPPGSYQCADLYPTNRLSTSVEEAWDLAIKHGCCHWLISPWWYSADQQCQPRYLNFKNPRIKACLDSPVKP